MAEKHDNTSIIEGLEAARRAIWHVDAMAGLLKLACDTDAETMAELDADNVGTIQQHIRDILGPTCEQIENAIIVLDGGKVPEPFKPGVTEPAVKAPQVSSVDTSDDTDGDPAALEYYAHRDREKSGNISEGTPYDDLTLRLERTDAMLQAIIDADMGGEARDIVSLPPSPDRRPPPPSESVRRTASAGADPARATYQHSTSPAPAGLFLPRI